MAPSDALVLLGDFNARIGRSVGREDVWDNVRGPFVVGECNEAGTRFCLGVRRIICPS